mmetsp:Transcript_16782/g.52637  ORF Transcript_16782/g.52637 Transcript_16782/m.52637 type:complete len:223 (+) Transcript_16782:256-924(+)
MLLSGSPASLARRGRLSPGVLPRVFSILSMRVSIAFRTNLLRFMTSLTVALLVPRSSSTLSIKSPKDRVFSPASDSESSCCSSKKRSVRSTRPTTSTPTSCSSLAAAGCSRIISYSAFVMLRSLGSWPPLSGKLVSRTCCSFDLTKATSNASFSVEETADTTSQRTPISMFIMVIAAIMTKKKKTVARKIFSFFSVSMITMRSSRKTPCIAKVYIDWPTLWK